MFQRSDLVGALLHTSLRVRQFRLQRGLVLLQRLRVTDAFEQSGQPILQTGLFAFGAGQRGLQRHDAQLDLIELADPTAKFRARAVQLAAQRLFGFGGAGLCLGEARLQFGLGRLRGLCGDFGLGICRVAGALRILKRGVQRGQFRRIARLQCVAVRFRIQQRLFQHPDPRAQFGKLRVAIFHLRQRGGEVSLQPGQAAKAGLAPLFGIG